MKGGLKLTNVDLSRPKVPTQAPKWLDVYGKKLWPKLANYLNKNSKVLRADEYLLQQYCSSYDIYRRAYESVKKDGLQQKMYKTTVSPVTGDVVAKDFAGFRKNPAVATMKDAVDTLNRIGVQLGLTPKGRQELLEIVGEETNKASTAEMLKEFLGK